MMWKLQRYQLVNSDLYFYQLNAGNSTAMRRMLVLKDTIMIALTAKAAKRFSVNYRELPSVMTGAWVVDCLKLPRGPLLLLCVHQDSLYTLIRRATGFRSLDQLATEIEETLPSVHLQRLGTCRKNGNRQVTGSMNEIKAIIKVLVDMGRADELEESINSTLFSMLDSACPRDRFQA